MDGIMSSEASEGPCDPFLPPELERLVFEYAAWGDEDEPLSQLLATRQARCANLMLVAKPVQAWVEPVMYHTLALHRNRDMVPLLRRKPSLALYIRVLLFLVIGPPPFFPDLSQEIEFVLTHAKNIHSISPTYLIQYMPLIGALPNLRHFFWVHQDSYLPSDLSEALEQLQNPEALTRITVVFPMLPDVRLPNRPKLDRFTNLRYVTFTLPYIQGFVPPVFNHVADEATQLDAVAVFTGGSEVKSQLGPVFHEKIVHVVVKRARAAVFLAEFVKLAEGRMNNAWDEIDRVVESRKSKEKPD